MSNPHGRRFNEVHTASAGDDVVMLVMDTTEYHALSHGAYEVWLAATGERSVAELAHFVFGRDSVAELSLTQIALDELAVAGLLESDHDDIRALLNRRQASRLAAAALVGGIGLPLVKSITVPDAASAVSRFGPRQNGDSCGIGLEGCLSGCCCASVSSSIQGICLDQVACVNYPAFCI